MNNESSIDPTVASNHASAMGAGAAVPLIGSEALRFARRSARINQTRSMHTSSRQVTIIDFVKGYLVSAFTSGSLHIIWFILSYGPYDMVHVILGHAKLRYSDLNFSLMKMG